MKIKWVSCKDELPKKNGRYLVCIGSGKDIAVRVDFYDPDGYTYGDLVVPKGFYTFDPREPYFWPSPYVTYWADLPEPPEEEQDGDNN